MSVQLFLRKHCAALTVTISFGLLAFAAWKGSIYGTSWADFQRDVSRTYLDAHVPAPEQFDGLLERDLLDWARATHGHHVRIEYRLLREKPTHVGTGHVWYFATVDVLDGGAARRSYLMRLIAQDRTEFAIYEALERTSITDEQSIRSYPKRLRAEILAWASAAEAR